MVGLWTYPTWRPFKLLKFSDWNLENRQNVILNNFDYICKGINTKALNGNISEMVLSVIIKDENTVAICTCVAELMI